MLRFNLDGISRSLRWPRHLRVEMFIGFAIIAYFCGWHYVNTFFSHFGINRSSLSFDHYTVFLYSFFVLVKLPSILISATPNAFKGLACLFFLLAISAIDIRVSLYKLTRSIQRLLAAAGAIAFLYYFSVEAGNVDARQIIVAKEARPVSVTLTGDVGDSLSTQYDTKYSDTWISEFRDAGRDGALALIWRNSEETVLLQYDTAIGASHGAPVATYRIPNDFVALIESRWTLEKGSQHVRNPLTGGRLNDDEDAKAQGD